MDKNINSNMEQYCIYLRKSRKDFELEEMGAGETLARHEATMLELAKKMKIIVTKIYKEIVSGDSISARPVMQELLQDVENGMWTGVLVMEVERLARGNTLDQGIVSNTFKFSNTRIITPTKTYDPNNEFDEEYFEFGLFMSRREYNTIKRRLRQGIISSVKEGKTVASDAPFGYERYKLKGKGFSLRIVEDNAKIIRMIFNMYTNGKNLGEIITALKKLDIKPPKGGKIWHKTTIQSMLTNITYTGKIKYVDKQYLKKFSNGKFIYVKNPNPDIYIVEGLHEAIIAPEVFQKAQDIYKSHQLADTRTKEQLELKNPLSGLLKCKCCGRTLKRLTNNKSEIIRIGCRSYDTASSHLDIVEKRVLDSLKKILDDYKLNIKSYTKKNEISESIGTVNNQISQLYNDLEKANNQKNKLYDFLEQGIYDQNIFLERSASLAERIKETQNKISELTDLKQEYSSLLEKQDNIIPNIEKVIETYSRANIEQKNKLLKSCIEKIEYYKAPGTGKVLDEFEITIFPKL